MLDSIQLAHPYAQSFDRVFQCRNDEEANSVAQGDVDAFVDALPEETTTTVHMTMYYIGLEIASQKGAGARKLDLSWPTAEFFKMVRMTDIYDDAKTVIQIKCIKRSQLPEILLDGDKTRQLKRTKPVSQLVDSVVGDGENSASGLKRLKSESHDVPVSPATPDLQVVTQPTESPDPVVASEPAKPPLPPVQPKEHFQELDSLHPPTSNGIKKSNGGGLKLKLVAGSVQ
jgi:poly(A) polymerase